MLFMTIRLSRIVDALLEIKSCATISPWHQFSGGERKIKNSNRSPDPLPESPDESDPERYTL